jgi:hypothetical protein
VLESVTPNHGYFEGGETVIVSGGPFFNRADFTYTCLFDDQPADSTTINPVNPSVLTCVTPSRRRLIGDVQLRVLLNGDDIAPNTPLNFTFFSMIHRHTFNDSHNLNTFFPLRLQLVLNGIRMSITMHVRLTVLWLVLVNQVLWSSNSMYWLGGVLLDSMHW